MYVCIPSRLVVGEFELLEENGKLHDIAVATAHFESYPQDEPIRRLQLEVHFSVLPFLFLAHKFNEFTNE